jgi:hypothetical protein
VLFILYNLYITARTANFFEGHFIWFSSFGALLYQIIFDKNDVQKTKFNQRGWALFFFIISVIYGLGSNNSLGITTASSSFFILLGFLCIINRDDHKSYFTLAGLVFGALLVTMSIICSTWQHPYRQISALWSHDTLVELPINSGKVKVHKIYAEFLNSLYTAVKKNGFAPNTPVIDLTGRMPGVIFSINGYLPKTPWLFSGYPGSEKYALHALNRLSCEELAQSWIIVYNEHHNSALNPNILYMAGLPNDTQYSLVGIFNFPGADAAGNIFTEKLKILQPLDSWKINAETCKFKRKDSNFIKNNII